MHLVFQQLKLALIEGKEFEYDTTLVKFNIREKCVKKSLKLLGTLNDKS